jgi:hypothetical protein
MACHGDKEPTERHNELTGAIKGGEFFAYLKRKYLLK